jgi:hypothetical protein
VHVFPDCETVRFRAGLMAPPIVCVQWVVDDGPAHLMTARGEFAHQSGSLSGPTSNTFGSLLAYWLNQGATLVGHNIAYDLACFCALPEASDGSLIQLVFRAMRENRITDTMWRQKLADIGRGKYRGFQAKGGWVQLNYDLGDVARRHGFKVDKNDPWRLHYDLLADVPLADWPSFSAVVPKTKTGTGDDEPEIGKDGQPILVQLLGPDAIKYALGDPIATRAAFVGQAQRYDPALLCDEFNQARKFWGLHLAEVWGLRTSLRGVMSLERGARERVAELGKMLQETREAGPMGEPGTPLVREDGSKDTKTAKNRMRAVCAEAGLTLRMTKGGKKGIPDVCLDSDASNSSGDPLLEAYSEYASMGKVLSNDVAALRRGMVVPIHTHFNVAETGRTTSAGPNVQNPRRLAGVRECFVPRGYVG